MILPFLLAASATLGRSDFSVTVKSPEARAKFEHGVLLLHSFMYDDAREDFRAATAKEPAFAMGYWGEAMTYNHPLWGEQDAASANAALAKIPSDAKLSAREQGFVDAVRLLYGGANGPAVTAEGGHCAIPVDKSAEKSKRDAAYMESMDRLYEAFPADDEVALFDALARISIAGPPASTLRLRMQGGAIALDVFGRHPNHPGAAHYVIHAFDDPEHAILALPAARHYARIAPSASHALHMPSHIFVQLGMWSDAEASNRASFAANETIWKARHQGPGDRDWHSNGFLSSIAMQEGKLSASEDAVALACGPDAATDLEVRFGCAFAASGLAIESNRPIADKLAAVADTPAPAARPDQNQSMGAVADLQFAYIRGLAAADEGKSAEAAREAAVLRSMIDKVKKYDDGSLGRIAEAEATQIEARLGKRLGKAAEWIAPLRKQADIEAADAPVGPAMRLPTQEVLADMLMASGDAAAAAVEYRGVLTRRPHRARALLGLARAKAKAGDAVGSADAYRELAAIWKSADSTWPDLAEVRAAGHTGPN